MWRNPRHAVLGEAIAIDDGVRPSGNEAADWSHSRRRLFVVLGWTAAAGLGTTAAFALLMGLFHFVFLSRIESIETGFRSVGLCTTVGFVCVLAVVWAAHEFCAGSRVRARVLLCTTCVVAALLMNVFTAGVITEGLMGTGGGDGASGHLAFVALTFIPVLAVVGLGTLTVLGVALSIGYDGSITRTAGRWIAFVVLIAGPLGSIDPALWWAGVLVSLVLAWGAACLVALLAASQVFVPW